MQKLRPSRGLMVLTLKPLSDLRQKTFRRPLRRALPVLGCVSNFRLARTPVPSPLCKPRIACNTSRACYPACSSPWLFSSATSSARRHYEYAVTHPHKTCTLHGEAQRQIASFAAASVNRPSLPGVEAGSDPIAEMLPDLAPVRDEQTATKTSSAASHNAPSKPTKRRGRPKSQPGVVT
jgi:hypothetical protein